MRIFDMLRASRSSPKSRHTNMLGTVWGEELDPEDVLSEYPRPQFIRNNYMSLNGLWDYCFTDVPEMPSHTEGRILVPFSPESALSRVGRTTEKDRYLWYFRTLPTLTPPFAGARLLLHFTAVDQIAEIYVNRRYLCTHIGGYLPFTVDATEAIANDGENTLAVRVQDLTEDSLMTRGKQSSDPGGMFYTSQSGIWQSVWAEWVPEVYIRGLVIVPEDDLTSVSVRVETNLPMSLELYLYDNTDTHFTMAIGRTVPANEPIAALDLCKAGSDLKPCNMTGYDCYRASYRLLIENAHLWSPEDPYLYQLRVRAGDDEIYAYFAMRHCAVKKDERGIPRFHLNHRPYFLNGVLDQGMWPDSLLTAPSDKALIFDITRMKALGFNTLRKHLKIEPPRFYYHCDRLGMLVMQDMVNGGPPHDALRTTYLPTLFPAFTRRLTDVRPVKDESETARRAQWEQELRGMILHLQSFPSIITWVIFNEGWGQFDANRMTVIVHALDPTRPIDQSSGWFDQGGGDYLSIHNYFYSHRAKRDNRGRAFLLSEFGGYACRIPGHSMKDHVYGYRQYATPEEWQEAVRELFQTKILPLIPKGLAGCIYTQLSDIEEEVNGILTYDRKVEKLTDAGLFRIPADDRPGENA